MQIVSTGSELPKGKPLIFGATNEMLLWRRGRASGGYPAPRDGLRVTRWKTRNGDVVRLSEPVDIFCRNTLSIRRDASRAKNVIEMTVRQRAAAADPVSSEAATHSRRSNSNELRTPWRKRGPRFSYERRLMSVFQALASRRIMDQSTK